MAFGDQIYRQKKLPRVNAMNAKQVLPKCLSLVARPFIAKEAQNSPTKSVLCN
ncbi:hypothetical protein ACROAE_17470 [Shewanella sp. MF05960]|uniref:hypothetical protein n=1 Tax=Shewanella sp. MF05960 TaxID=3434874 RepID=UPI003D79381C